jgi:FtsP/CotA-like multicopper oxidase with cupredoxin domain
MRRLGQVSLWLGLLLVTLPAAAARPGVVREYWIAAERVQWNYAPSGKNLIDPAMGLGVWGQTLTYAKYRYIGYTDGSYSTPLPQPPWIGILGPELRAVVGDTLIVHLQNKSDRPVSMHPHGLGYDQDNSGGDPGAGAVVLPGKSFTYRWQVDQAAGPGPNDPSSILWLYHSHVDHDQADIYAGLIGTIIVTRAGMEGSADDPSPRDMEREFTTLFMIFDEESGEEPGLKHALNGRIFGNLEGYEARLHERVRWHLVALGNEVDLHTAHWHGQTVLEHGRRTDVVELLPASMVSVTMRPRSPGTWLFHCHVADHMAAGMMTHWRVKE